MTHEQNISEKTTAALDNSVEALSPEIQSRLQAARNMALENRSTKHQSLSKNTPKLWPFFTPKVISAGLAFSVFAFLAVDISLDNLNNTSTTNINMITSNSVLGEFILSNDFDETELDIIEDIEFAYWLSQELENDHDNNPVFSDDRQQHNG